MLSKKLPVMMADQVMGYIQIDEETGSYEGKFDPEYTNLLTGYFEGGLMQMILMGRPGPQHNQEELNKKIQVLLGRLEAADISDATEKTIEEYRDWRKAHPPMNEDEA